MVDGDAKEVICFGTNVLWKYMAYFNICQKESAFHKKLSFHDTSVLKIHMQSIAFSH